MSPKDIMLKTLAALLLEVEISKAAALELSETVNEGIPSREEAHLRIGRRVVRMVRQLQEISQNQLSQLTGIPQATISAIENDRVRLSVERAKMLARALKCHPGVLVFPGSELSSDAVA